jgi:hypothetical protein
MSTEQAFLFAMVLTGWKEEGVVALGVKLSNLSRFPCETLAEKKRTRSGMQGSTAAYVMRHAPARKNNFGLGAGTRMEQT